MATSVTQRDIAQPRVVMPRLLLLTRLLVCIWCLAGASRAIASTCSLALPSNAAAGSCPTTLTVPASRSCSIACLQGFSLNGTSTTTCPSSGTTLSSTQSCVPASCTSVTAPTHGSLGTCTSVIESGSSCSIECDSNYNLAGLSTSCLAGVLTMQSCVPAGCVVNQPTNGGFGTCLVDSAMPSGTACGISCDEGYYVAGANTSCLAGALTSQTCEPKSCAITSPQHGTLGSCTTTLASGASCSIACPTGFSIVGDSTTTCSLGVQTGIQDCWPDSCAVSLPANAAMGSCSAKLLSNQSCSLSCEAGYVLSGNATSCWAGSLVSTQTCVPGSCALSAPSFGTLGNCPESLASGATCLLACQTGYTLSSSTSISCTAGHLSMLPTCVPQACSISLPTNALAGTCNSTLASGASCSLTCAAGYTLQGSETNCTTGVPSLQSCVPSSCAVEAPYGGSLGSCSTSGLSSGQSCSFECSTDFTLSADAMSCSLGVINATQTCEPTGCAIAAPLHGALGTCGSSPLQSSTKCVPTCDVGYTPDLNFICSSKGVLTQAGTCSPISCSVTAPTGGSLGSCGSTLASGGSCQMECDSAPVIGDVTTCSLGTLSAQTCGSSYCTVELPTGGAWDLCTPTLANGSECSIACSGSYQLVGTSIVCTNGVLTSQQSCAPNPCTVAMPKNGGFGTCTNYVQGMASGDTCQISCDAGYTVQGGETICLAGSMGTQACTPNSCTVPTPLNGALGNCTDPLVSGTSCDIICLDGYSLVGGSTTCQAGVLTSFQTCEPATCSMSAASQSACPSILLDGQTCSARCGGFGGIETYSCASGEYNSSDTCNSGACALATPTHVSDTTCGSSLPSTGSCKQECNDGYDLIGSMSTTCYGGSLYSLQDCSPSQCSPPDAPVNGSLGTCANFKTLNSGESCTMECDPGYSLVGDATTCTSGDITAIQSCAPSSCTALTVPTYGSQGNCPTLELADGGSCSYACDYKYGLSNPTTSCSLGVLVSAQECFALSTLQLDVVLPTVGSTVFCGQSFYSNFILGAYPNDPLVATVTTVNALMIGQQSTLTMTMTTFNGLRVDMTTMADCQTVTPAAGLQINISFETTSTQFYAVNPLQSLTVVPKRSVSIMSMPSSLLLGQYISSTLSVTLPSTLSSATLIINVTDGDPAISNITFTTFASTQNILVQAPSVMPASGGMNVSFMWVASSDSTKLAASTVFLTPTARFVSLQTPLPLSLSLTPAGKKGVRVAYGGSRDFTLSLDNQAVNSFMVTATAVNCSLSASGTMRSLSFVLSGSGSQSFAVYGPARPANNQTTYGSLNFSTTVNATLPALVALTFYVPLASPNGDAVIFTVTLAMIVTYTPPLAEEIADLLGLSSAQVRFTSVQQNTTLGLTYLQVTVDASTDPVTPTPIAAVTQLQSLVNGGANFTTPMLATAVKGSLVITSPLPPSSSSSSTGAYVSSSTGSSARVVSTPAQAVSQVSPPITVATGTSDPCSLQPNFCANGGTCVATVVNASVTSTTSSVQLSCNCPRSFFGPHCEVGILACTDGCASRMGGNVTLSLYGVGFSYLADMTISGLALPFVLNGSLPNSDPRIVSEIVTASRGGPWPDSTLTSFQEFDVLYFETPAYATIKAETTTDESEEVESYDGLAFNPLFHALMFDTTLPAPSYQAVTAEAEFSTDSGMIQVPYSVAPVYYAVSNCPAGQFQNSIGDCIDCPTGCACPGSGRCWPLPGYWSYSQSSLPIKCSYAASCPGVVTSSGTTSAYATSNMANQETVDTQICAEGYTGTGCTSCADNYYQLNSRCYSCGSSTDQTSQMVTILIAGVAVTVGLAICVATLDATRLVYVVTAVVLLQQIVATGASGAQDLPGTAGKDLAIFFSYVSVINFDLEILRPGCTVPTFTFLLLFWATVALIAFSALLFLLAVLARYVVRRIKELSGLGLSFDEQRALTERALAAAKIDLIAAAQTSHLFHTPAEKDFKRRIAHACIVLATIFYLKLNTLMVKMFMCEHAPDPQSPFAPSPGPESLYLSADLQTRCYQGAHLASTIIVAILFVIYSFGFPFGIFVLLCRAFSDYARDGFTGVLTKRFALLRPRQSKSEERREAYAAMQAEEDKHRANELVALGGQALDTNSASDKYAMEKAGSMRVTVDPALTSLYIEHRRIGLYAYLFLGIRHEAFAYRMSSFLTDFFFALVTSLVSSTVTQLFLLGLCFAAESLVVCWSLPFHLWRNNARTALVALAQLGHVCIQIGLQTDAVRRPMLYISFVVFVIVCLFLFKRVDLLRAIRQRSVGIAPKKITSESSSSGHFGDEILDSDRQRKSRSNREDPAESISERDRNPHHRTSSSDGVVQQNAQQPGAVEIEMQPHTIAAVEEPLTQNPLLARTQLDAAPLLPGAASGSSLLPVEESVQSLPTTRDAIGTTTRSPGGRLPPLVQLPRAPSLPLHAPTTSSEDDELPPLQDDSVSPSTLGAVSPANTYISVADLRDDSSDILRHVARPVSLASVQDGSPITLASSSTDSNSSRRRRSSAVSGRPIVLSSAQVIAVPRQLPPPSLLLAHAATDAASAARSPPNLPPTIDWSSSRSLAVSLRASSDQGTPPPPPLPAALPVTSAQVRPTEGVIDGDSPDRYT